MPTTALLPATVINDPRIKSCSAPHTFIIQYPNLDVTATVHGTALTLHLQLLSAIPTDANFTTHGKPLRAFIQIDKQSVLFTLPVVGKATISMGDFPAGSHVLRYGVYIGGTFLNGGVKCLTFGRDRRSR
jgi:hypothetical protein